MITYHHDSELFSKCLRTPLHREVLRWFGLYIEKSVEWNKEEIKKLIRETLEQTGGNMKIFYEVITGSPTGLPLPDILEAMGRDRVRERLFDMSCWEEENN